MAVKREYRCLAHGPFEAYEAKCPHGCDTAIDREFRTAPGTRSPKTRATDVALERLAARFGMTDLSNRNGSVAASRKVGDLDFSPQWQEVPKGDNLEIGRGIVPREGSAGGAAAAAQGLHTGRIGDELVATEQVPLPLGTMPPKPRPHVVGKDSVSGEDFTRAMGAA